MGWKGESRRHSLARKGIRTNIDDGRRFDVSSFVAKGKKLPEVDYGTDVWEFRVNPDGSMRLRLGNMTTAGWYWTGDETDLGTFLVRIVNFGEMDEFKEAMAEAGISFDMLKPFLLKNIDEPDGNGMYSITGDNVRWKFGEAYDIDVDEEVEYLTSMYELSDEDKQEIKDEHYWNLTRVSIDDFEKTKDYEEIKGDLEEAFKLSDDFDDFSSNIKELKENVFWQMIEYDQEVEFEDFERAFDIWKGKKKKEGRTVKKIKG